jgi:hypothetical protein
MRQDVIAENPMPADDRLNALYTLLLSQTDEDGM